LLTEHGAPPLATFVTEYATNDFPALPVREGEHVLVRFTTFTDASTYAHHTETLAQSRRWNEAAATLARYLVAAPTDLELTPTPRSLLR
ncbi:MAG: NIPSNAP family protein, partial [Candidatus Eremiobacteraeota bacterium]|nr:NIPSNAP family protein [Candidatus Eremiobacteraeota bacterium]